MLGEILPCLLRCFHARVNVTMFAAMFILGQLLLCFLKFVHAWGDATVFADMSSYLGRCHL